MKDWLIPQSPDAHTAAVGRKGGPQHEDIPPVALGHSQMSVEISWVSEDLYLMAAEFPWCPRNLCMCWWAFSYCPRLPPPVGEPAVSDQVSLPRAAPISPEDFGGGGGVGGSPWENFAVEKGG